MNGKTGRAILRAILAGARDPQRLARHRDRRCKHAQATIAKALEGHWRAEHLCALQQALEQYAFLQQQLQACEQQIDACLQTCVTHVEVELPQPTPARKRRARQRQAPSFDVHKYLDAMTGVDLTQIDGIDALKQLLRSLRRNRLPVKLIDGAFLMRHEYAACALVELLQIGKAPSRADPVLQHAPEAFDGIEVVAANGPGSNTAETARASGSASTRAYAPGGCHCGRPP